MSKSSATPSTCPTTPETVTKKVRQMYTDPKRVRADIPGTVEGNPVFIYHDAFNPNTAEVDDLKARYRAGKVGDVEVKTKLAQRAERAPRADARAARGRAGQPERLREILVEGSKRARDGRGRDDGARARRDEDLVPMSDRTGSARTISNRRPTPSRSSSTASRARSICCCTSSRRTR